MSKARDPRVWARLTVDFADSPKIASLSDAAFRALVEMILWSRRMNTDGVLPARLVETHWVTHWVTESVTQSVTQTETQSVTDPVAELLSNDPDCPSLRRDERGNYVIHDFLEHQESAADVKARLGRNRANGQRGGRPRKTQSVTESVTESVTQSGTDSGTQTETQTESRDRDRDRESLPKGKDVSPTRQDVARVCDHMADSVKARTGKRPKVTKTWRDAARLLIDRDGHSEADCIAAIDWSAADEFWRSNVLSLPTLRKQYDRLSLQAQRGRPKPTPLNIVQPTTDEQVTALVADLWTPTTLKAIHQEEAS